MELLLKTLVNIIIMAASAVSKTSYYSSMSFRLNLPQYFLKKYKKKVHAGLFEARYQITHKCPEISAYCCPTKAITKNRDILLLSVLSVSSVGNTLLQY